MMGMEVEAATMAIVVVAVVDAVTMAAAVVVVAMARAAVAVHLIAVDQRSCCLTSLKPYPSPRKVLDWTSLYVLR